jgi:hypothetical protein
MRRFLPLALLAALLAGCTDYIPVKDDFDTSALRRSGKTPPEYAGFNNYDPAVNALLTSQMCATPYALLEQKLHPAVPGELITWRPPPPAGPPVRQPPPSAPTPLVPPAAPPPSG